MYRHQYNPYAANVEIVKGYLKGGKTLILGVLNLLSIAVSFITLFVFSSEAYLNSYTDMLRDLGIDPSQLGLATAGSAMMSSSKASMIFTTTVSSVFTLLAAIGFIVMFAKSRNDDPSSNPSSGAGILRVLSLIGFICAIIVVVLLVILFVLAYFFLDSLVSYANLDSSAATVLWIGCGVLILIVSIFYLIITASCKNFYRSIKRSLTTVDLHTKGSVAFGVFNIIGAIFMGLSLVGSLISVISAFSAATLTSALASGITFITCVMTAAFALGYNSYIKEQKLSYAAPHDGGPSGAYFPSDYNNAPNPYAAPRQDKPYQDNYANYNAPQSPAVCPNCGAPTDGSPFCSNCGTKL